MVPSATRPAVDCVLPPDLAWKHVGLSGGGGGGLPNPCSPVPCQPGIDCTVFCNELALAPAAGIKPREALQKRSGDSSPCGGGLGDGGGGSDGGQMNPCFSTQTCGSDPACYGASGGCLGCTIDAGCVVFDQIGYCISGCGNYQPPTIPDPSSCAVYGIPAIDAIIGSDYKLRSLIILLANFHLRPRIVLGSLPAHIAATTISTALSPGMAPRLQGRVSRLTRFYSMRPFTPFTALSNRSTT